MLDPTSNLIISQVEDVVTRLPQSDVSSPQNDAIRMLASHIVALTRCQSDFMTKIGEKLDQLDLRFGQLVQSVNDSEKRLSALEQRETQNEKEISGLRTKLGDLELEKAALQGFAKSIPWLWAIIGFLIPTVATATWYVATHK